MLALLSFTVKSPFWWSQHGHMQFVTMNSALGTWHEEITTGSITKWNGFGVVFFFLFAHEIIGFVLLKCVHIVYIQLTKEKICIRAIFLFPIKRWNPETPWFLLNFTFLNSLHFYYDFQKWCVISASFVSGSPKWGVTDVHSVLNLCSTVAEPLGIADYTCISCTSRPFIFPLLATGLSRILENCSNEISWSGVVLHLPPKFLSGVPDQLLRFFFRGRQ